MTEEHVYMKPEDAIAAAMARWADGHPKDAEYLLRSVLEAFPKNSVAMYRLGSLLADQGSFYEALYWLDESLLLERKNAVARCNRGMVLAELKHYDRALSDFQISLSINPNSAVTWNNVGNTNIFLDRYSEAVEALKRSLKIDPEHALSWYNLGIAQLRQGKTEEALVALNRAMYLEPEMHDARFNMSMGQLLLGDFANGFRNYEARWDTAEYEGYRRAFPQPLWHGEDLRGKSIVVYGDQGFGDAIMFSRYIPMIVERGGTVYCNPHSGIRDLFIGTFDNVAWLFPGQPSPEFDFRCALPSAPRAFRTTLDTIPAPVPMRVPADVKQKFADVMPEPFKVGVCWSGNWKHVNDAFRSVPLKTFARLFDIDDAAFYSLQYEVREEDREAFNSAIGLKRLELKTWIDTAAAITNLDLVITVDTSVAHLAATMGKPTWIMLPEPRMDWRWMKTRTDSPWYPSVKLWRQDKPGDWGEVIRRIRRELDTAAAIAA